ncbi:Kunitz-CH [Fasciolopsis buskii]|uniref:Kunitz-CH n=1 Tax=Fasciolopsis buskii TaxID=27845 RepID=A0A8E0RMN6_9TREM|nr:Kunitz-CH [Fasciolopsis buski]
MRCLTVTVLLTLLLVAITFEGSVAIPAACFLPVESGPCRAAFRSWAWDSEQRRCVPFTYGGCRGNRNRFHSQKSCERACGFRFN